MPRGIPRKQHLQQLASKSTPKTVLQMLFDELGGFEAALEWAKKNPDKFYKDLYFKTSPAFRQSNYNPKGGGNHRDHRPKADKNVVVREFDDDE